MIKDNQKVFNNLLVLIDAVITGISFILSYFIKFYILENGPGVGVLPVREYVNLLIFLVVVFSNSVSRISTSLICL